jgi:hypothetical protein
MWRKLFRVVHPDTGGEHGLFIWVQALHEHVAGDAVEEAPPHTRREPPRHPTTGDRLDYVDAYTKADSFHELTRLAVAMADTVAEPYAGVLRMLHDCYEVPAMDANLYRQQNVGATYKQLAYVAHLVGMNAAQRTRFYRIAEELPLSQRHAGHLIGRLQQAA